ncbi:MAG: DUF2318 domain-containing protein, partial [Spirochaetaceae bacterium]|nr:DUF2318 domain-containing protein [Spirochaetaceae bacterium]
MFDWKSFCFRKKSGFCFSGGKKSAVAAAIAVVLLLMAGTCLFAQNSGANAGQLNLIKPAVADRDLVIPVTEINENAIFYPVDIQGTRLEVIAVKAPDGSLRTAFNTCQVCYASGRGFYKQQG